MQYKHHKQHAPGALFNAHKDKMEKKHKKHHKNWIQGAIKHPGALHSELGVPQGQKIPPKKLAAAAKKGGIRPASAVVKSEQNASHQFYKKHKKAPKNDHDADDKMKHHKKHKAMKCKKKHK